MPPTFGKSKNRSHFCGAICQSQYEIESKCLVRSQTLNVEVWRSVYWAQEKKDKHIVIQVKQTGASNLHRTDKDWSFESFFRKKSKQAYSTNSFSAAGDALRWNIHRATWEEMRIGNLVALADICSVKYLDMQWFYLNSCENKGKISPSWQTDSKLLTFFVSFQLRNYMLKRSRKWVGSTYM